MEIEIKEILLQLLNFGILAAVLGKFLFKPVLNLLDARAKKVAEGMAAAERNSKAAAELEKKQTAELAAATKKAASIISEAKAESKKLGVALMEEAKAVSAAELEKQRVAFQKELDALEQGLQGKIATLVVETTKAVLKDTLKPEELKAITAKEIAKLK